MQSLHSLGYLHNDIKPENILIGIAPESIKASSASSTQDIIFLHLIDFGISSSYLNTEGLHYEDSFDQALQFRGNIIFSSSNLFHPSCNFSLILM